MDTQAFEYSRDVLSGAKIVVGQQGGQVICLDGYGEILFELGLKQGIHPAEDVLQIMPPDTGISLDGAATLIGPTVARDTRLVRAQRHRLQFESGANQDYVPKLTDKAVHEANRLLAAVQRENRKAERRRAEDRRERLAQQEADEQVILAEREAERERLAEEAAEAERQRQRESDEAAAQAGTGESE